MTLYILTFLALDLHTEDRRTYDPIACYTIAMKINWQRHTEFIRIPDEGGKFQKFLVTQARCIKAGAQELALAP